MSVEDTYVYFRNKSFSRKSAGVKTVKKSSYYKVY